MMGWVRHFLWATSHHLELCFKMKIPTSAISKVHAFYDCRAKDDGVHNFCTILILEACQGLLSSYQFHEAYKVDVMLTSGAKIMEDNRL